MCNQIKFEAVLSNVLLVFLLSGCVCANKLTQETEAERANEEYRVETAEPSSDTGEPIVVQKETADESLWEKNILIGHSFGSVDGHTYTGSLEAFQKRYGEGIRVFEVDFSTATDGNIVLRHDWDAALQEGVSSENIPTSEEFKGIPILGEYTPLTFVDLLQLMKEYPDIWIITDSKATEKEEVRMEFSEMVREAEKSEMNDVLDRFIIQIYNEGMLDVVKEVYPFSNYIFTLYARWYGDLDDFENICRWCVLHNVKYITMWNYRYNERIKAIAQKYGLDIYVHTENAPLAGANYLANGVKGLYTDLLTEDILAEYSDVVRVIFFSGTNYNAKDYVFEGISEPEEGFSWTNGNRLYFWIPVKQEDNRLKIEMVIGGIYGESQSYTVVQDGIAITDGNLMAEGTLSFTASAKDGLCIFEMKLPNAVSPNELEGKDDKRSLALQLKQIIIRKDFSSI